MSTDSKMLNAESALYRYLNLLQAGAKMTVRTKNSGSARTNVLAVLMKEEQEWGDWQVMSRPATANPALLPDTFGNNSGIISSRSLADALDANPDLWADVTE